MPTLRSLLASLALATTLIAAPHADARNFARPPGQPAQAEPVTESEPVAEPAPVDEPVAEPPIDAPIARVARAKVRAKLAERRKLTIRRFLAYRDARVYPQNDRTGFEHVWLDRFGNLCAAATIISKDWGRAASERIAAENNNIALADVTEGELYDWILTSGMTQAEIVAIQAPGFVGGEAPVPREQEVQRLYVQYLDVERQIRGLDKHNLELAVDELMKHPQLAEDLVAGKIASAGHYGAPRAKAVARR